MSEKSVAISPSAIVSISLPGTSTPFSILPMMSPKLSLGLGGPTSCTKRASMPCSSGLFGSLPARPAKVGTANVVLNVPPALAVTTTACPASRICVWFVPCNSTQYRLPLLPGMKPSPPSVMRSPTTPHDLSTNSRYGGALCGSGWGGLVHGTQKLMCPVCSTVSCWIRSGCSSESNTLRASSKRVTSRSRLASVTCQPML